VPVAKRSRTIRFGSLMHERRERATPAPANRAESVSMRPRVRHNIKCQSAMSVPRNPSVTVWVVKGERGCPRVRHGSPGAPRGRGREANRARQDHPGKGNRGLSFPCIPCCICIPESRAGRAIRRGVTDDRRLAYFQSRQKSRNGLGESSV
jgi:hypothetical protein